MTAKTETPRTDAAWNPARIAERGVASILNEMRELEHELTQLRDENERLKHERNRVAMEVRSELLPKIARWREVAGRLATAATLYGSGNPNLINALNAYDALAKLLDGGKG